MSCSRYAQGTVEAQNGFSSPVSCLLLVWVLCFLEVPLSGWILGLPALKLIRSHSLIFISPLGKWYTLNSSPILISIFLCLLCFFNSSSLSLSLPSFSHLSLYFSSSSSPTKHTHNLSPAAPRLLWAQPFSQAGMQTICGARNKQELGGCGVAAW